MSAPRDLVAEARALATPPIGETRRQHSPLVEARDMIHRLADEVDRLRSEVAKLGVIRDTNRREYHDLHVSCEQRVMERNDAWAQLAAIREVAADWAEQPPDTGLRVQQIEDGCALLLLIDGRTLPEEPR